MTSTKEVKPKESGLLMKLYETTLAESPTIMCIERHVRNEHGRSPLMDKTKKACKYGRERGNATICGDCPYGMKLFEPKPVHDTHEILKQLKEEQRKKTTFII